MRSREFACAELRLCARIVGRAVHRVPRVGLVELRLHVLIVGRPSTWRARRQEARSAANMCPDTTANGRHAPLGVRPCGGERVRPLCLAPPRAPLVPVGKRLQILVGLRAVSPSNGAESDCNQPIDHLRELRRKEALHAVEVAQQKIRAQRTPQKSQTYVPRFSVQRPPSGVPGFYLRARVVARVQFHRLLPQVRQVRAMDGRETETPSPPDCLLRRRESWMAAQHGNQRHEIFAACT